jgi:hypothetical protein
MMSMGRTLEKLGPALYSPECVEVEFCELRVDGVLGSSRVWTDSVGSLSKEEQHRAYPQQVDKCEGEAHQEEDRL